MAVREYLDKKGLGKLIELLHNRFKRTWHGTRTEWDALSDEEKAQWEQAEIEEEDGNNGNGVVYVADKVEKGNYNPVTSNAVAELVAPPAEKVLDWANMLPKVSANSSGADVAASRVRCDDWNDVKVIYTATQDCMLYVHFKESSEASLVSINENNVYIGFGDDASGVLALPLKKGDVVKGRGGFDQNTVMYRWTMVPYKEEA